VPSDGLRSELPSFAFELSDNEVGPSLEAGSRRVATKVPYDKPSLGLDSETNDAIAAVVPGPQSPSLNISWVGLSGINVGEETSCEILIRNTGQSTAYDVVVRSSLPDAVRFMASEPAPESIGKTMVWKLGQIEPRKEQRIRLKLYPEGKGNVTATASITFSSVICAPIKIEEPQLALEITAPEQVILGDPTTVVITVSNPGTSTASEVIVACVLPQGLNHPNGEEIEYAIGALAPGEARAVQVSVTASATGTQPIRALAQSGSRLKCPAEATVQVGQPELMLKVGGPSLRYLDREATYTLTALNPGSVTANSVRLAATIPAGFQFVRASDSGKHDWTSRSVSWFVGQLGANETREIQLTLLASDAGPQKLQAVAAAERGLKANAEAITQIEGISALLLEVVDVADPIEVGAETVYEIRVTNQGSKVATNIQIVAELPQEMQPLDTKGPVSARIDGRSVTFGLLPRLGPRAEAIYRVKVRGNDAGDLRFRAKMTSDVLQSPVVKEESTRVYKD
jgi:uncharacterized repeat protein (TIGR01451 family)